MAGARTSTSLATQSRAANQAARDTDVVFGTTPLILDTASSDLSGLFATRYEGVRSGPETAWAGACWQHGSSLARFEQGWTVGGAFWRRDGCEQLWEGHQRVQSRWSAWPSTVDGNYPKISKSFNLENHYILSYRVCETSKIFFPHYHLHFYFIYPYEYSYIYRERDRETYGWWFGTFLFVHILGINPTD